MSDSIRPGQFFQFDARLSGASAQANSEEPFDAELHCLKVRGIIPLTFLDFEQCHGRQMRDVMTGTLACEILIHERVLAAWEVAGITGFKGVPVRYKTYEGEILTSYQFFVVTGRCADFPGNRGTRQLDPPKLGWEVGLPIDLATWDGSDVFMPHSFPHSIIVTKKVVQICRHIKISGAYIVDVTKVRLTTV